MVEGLPPEILLGWKVSGPFEVETFDDVVVFGCPFNSPPKIEYFKVVLVAELQYASLEEDDLLGGEGLSDSVDEFKF